LLENPFQYQETLSPVRDHHVWNLLRTTLFQLSLIQMHAHNYTLESIKA